MAGRLRVALVEPYYTGSHRAWADGLAASSACDVSLVTHEGGFWKWRMQGAALTLAEGVRAGGRPDVLLVSDMVHVPALLGLARDVVGGVPVVLYMHENQLTYPLPDDAEPDHTYAMANWLSMCAADRVVFNSEYHRGAWFDALPRLLRRFPDYRHGGWVESVMARSTVLPVGVDALRLAADGRVGAAQSARSEPPLVLWNHRWEYDKGPAACFDALSEVLARGVAFRLAVAGQQFQTVPPAFDAARRRFGDRVVWFGTAPRQEYESLLRQADVVVSTARHEFFGLSVLEAAAAGAAPVLPRRLSYPELFGDEFLYDGPDDLVERLCALLSDPERRRAAGAAASARAAMYDWSAVAPFYDGLFSAMVEA